MAKPVLLILERDELLRQPLCALFSAHGFECIQVKDEASLLHSFGIRTPALVIIGDAPGGVETSLACARHIRRKNKSVPLVLISAVSSEELLLATLRAGINDFYKKPFSFDDLIASASRLVVGLRTPHLTEDSSRLIGEARLVGESLPMQEIKTYIEKVASTDTNVLITGETGTGKELAAEMIHNNSRRRQKPFVRIDCAAVPDTLLESELFGYERGAFTGAYASRAGKLRFADGGTAFFDEIGDMSLSAQAKILRAIENKEVARLGARSSTAVDVRVIAATNQDLERLVDEGKFRKDLYFRLNVARISLPSLRDRKWDIPLLLDHYIHALNHQLARDVQGFTEEASEELLRYDWPGNIRELRNVVEAVLVASSSGWISIADLPPHFRTRLAEAAGLPGHERDRLLSALFSTNWNKSKAAQRLHWSRMTLYRKIAKYRLIPGARSSRPTTQHAGPGSSHDLRPNPADALE